jgi:protease-4
MTTRTQGLALGCFLVVASGIFVVLTVSMLFPWGRTPANAVGLVVLEGPITSSRALVEEIEANRTDPSIHAVVFRVDSPGGEVAPAQEIYQALARLSEEKPLVASVGGLAASGAFYAAVAADSILAAPGSLIGSIGAIIMYPTARELMEKVGVSWQVYKSGRLKDMGSFAREPTEEEEAVFDAIIADVFDQFVTTVAGERRLDRDVVLSVADGRVFSGRQALDLGLIDRLGDLRAAVNSAASLSGLGVDPPLVRKRRPRIPALEILDELFRDQTRATWGPRVEYRLR